VRYNWARIGRVAAVATVFLAASEWLIPQAGILWFAVRLVLALAFPLALVASGAITRAELRRGREIARQRGRRFWSRDQATVDSVDELV